MQFFDERSGVAMGDGGAQETRDGGTTWHDLPIPGFSASDSSLSGWFIDSQTGYYLHFLGGFTTIGRTTDGGHSWQKVREWRERP